MCVCVCVCTRRAKFELNVCRVKFDMRVKFMPQLQKSKHKVYPPPQPPPPCFGKDWRLKKKNPATLACEAKVVKGLTDKEGEESWQHTAGSFALKNMCVTECGHHMDE